MMMMMMMMMMVMMMMMMMTLLWIAPEDGDNQRDKPESHLSVTGPLAAMWRQVAPMRLTFAAANWSGKPIKIGRFFSKRKRLPCWRLGAHG